MSILQSTHLPVVYVLSVRQLRIPVRGTLIVTNVGKESWNFVEMETVSIWSQKYNSQFITDYIVQIHDVYICEDNLKKFNDKIDALCEAEVTGSSDVLNHPKFHTAQRPCDIHP